MSRYFQKITGLADVSGPAADLLPEDEALGFIPDWAILLDPSYLSADATGGIYNRVNNSLMRNRASEAGAFAAVPLGTLSGQQAFAPSATAPMTVTSPVAINSERWSFFTVGQYEVSSNAQHLAVSLEAQIAGSSGLNPRVGVTASANEMAVWTYGAFGDQTDRRRIGSGAAPLTARANLLLWTFSVDRGVTARLNGVEVRRAAGDRRPLTAGFSADQWRLFSLMRGRFGMTGLINRDLTALENWAHLTSLETFLMQKYSITA